MELSYSDLRQEFYRDMLTTEFANERIKISKKYCKSKGVDEICDFIAIHSNEFRLMRF